MREDFPFELAGSRPAWLASTGHSRSAVGLKVVEGGEVALSRLPDLDDETLGSLSLAGGGYLLVESPYGTMGETLEAALFDLQVRGLRPLLAHPERCPSFLSSPRA